MSERAGVEIDYCPQCRGVWLDRGELDKILERSAAEIGGGQPSRTQAPAEYRDAPRHHDDDRYKHHHKHRRKSFLDDMFDFD